MRLVFFNEGLADTLGIVHYFCDDFWLEWHVGAVAGGLLSALVGSRSLRVFQGAVEFREFFGPKCLAEQRCTNRTYPKWSKVFVAQFFFQTKTLNVVVFFLWLTMNPTQAQWILSIKIISEKKAASLSIWNAVYIFFPLNTCCTKTRVMTPTPFVCFL